MKPLTLVLTTKAGDELGRLCLSDVQVAAAGEVRGGQRRPLAEQMAAVYARIQTTLEQEGLSCTLDRMDLEIAVSRALLQADGMLTEPTVALPIRDTLRAADVLPDTFPAAPMSGWERKTEGRGTDHSLNYDDLFRLEENEENDDDNAG